LALILLHQSVIARSSFFLTRLIEVFQQKGDYRIYLVCYLAAMLFPYLPGCASYVTLQSWINSAHRRCVTRLSDTSFGLTEKYRDSDTRRRIEAIVSRNSFIVIKDYLTFLHGFFGFFLNSFLSMLVLGILLPGNLLTGYFLSVALCLVIVLFSKKWIRRLSTTVEGEFIVYSETLSKIWDNATLGNKYNFALWSKRKSQFADRYYSQSTRLQLTKQSGNLVLACASLGPTIYLVFHVLQAPSADPALIAAVIVNFTRIFHILNSLSSLVYQLLDWASMTARLRVVFDAEESLFSATDLPSMPTGKIRLNEIPIYSFGDVTAVISEKPKGRFTIKGANGSGKSTLLQFIKKTMGDRAMLIPANQGNLVWTADTQNLSTGQSALLRIQEAASQVAIIYILLDEWDANLDEENTSDVDQMLNELSQTKVVIEVRH
jgi:ABC-type bacteriocin/lantibiotic exporter with double-glycine peptidase domain